MKLNSLVKNIIHGTDDLSDINIHKICTNSKNVDDGSLFIAINGVTHDGHNYVNEAIENGAAAVISNGKDIAKLPVPNLKVSNTRLAASRVAAEFYNYPSKELKIIGITGTNGKTSTASLIYAILKQAGFKAAQIGTLGVIADGFNTKKTLTTPDPITLHKILRGLSDNNFTHAVMEVSSHALDQYRVADIDFNISIFTNLSDEHLDYHKDIKTYFKAKSRLFRMMPITGTSIIHTDKDYGKKMKLESSAPVVSVSMNDEADIYFQNLNYSLAGINGIIKTGNKKITFNSKLIGEFNAENIISAVSAGIILNISSQDIKRAIEDTNTIDGRMEIFKTRDEKIIVVDYAHTPDSYFKVLSTLKKLLNNQNKIHVLFGCGGNRDSKNRNQMGKIAADFAHKIWITPDNPRYENIEKINAEILKEIDKNKYNIFSDRKNGIEKAIGKINRGDMLVIFGKGRENYQDINGIKIKYSDIEIIEKYL